MSHRKNHMLGLQSHNVTMDGTHKQRHQLDPANKAVKFSFLPISLTIHHRKTFSRRSLAATHPSPLRCIYNLFSFKQHKTLNLLPSKFVSYILENDLLKLGRM